VIGLKRNRKATRQRQRLRESGWKPKGAHAIIERLGRIRLTDLEAAWLAGFVDGEGHIGLKPAGIAGRLVPRLSVVNTHRATLEAIRRMTGAGFITPLTRASKAWKPAFQWEATNTAALGIVRALQPYLRVKRRQARVLMRYLSTYRFGLGGPAEMRRIHKRREAMRTELRRLNQRGAAGMER
jgi:hypothetical protein